MLNNNNNNNNNINIYINNLTDYYIEKISKKNTLKKDEEKPNRFGQAIYDTYRSLELGDNANGYAN